MRKKRRGPWFLLAGILFCLCAWVFRHDVLFSFQRYRLKAAGENAGKVWPHRVNGPERLTALLPHFSGFELDVVWVGDNIIVQHPPYAGSHFTLSQAFAMDDAKKKQWWVDIKEADTAIFHKMTAALAEAVEERGIRRQVILETSDTTLLFMLKQRQLQTAFNCSAGVSPDKLSPETRRSISLNADFISFDIRDQPSVDAVFPDQKKIVWALAFNYFLSREKLTELLNDSSYSIVLMNIKSEGYR